MSVYTMVVFIVLIVTIGRIYRDRQKIALKNLPPTAETGDARRLQSEVARLNERIQVLERLATDPAKRLSDEIESLKSLPQKPAAPVQETDNAQR
jgi:hypothetical protein